MPVNDPVIEDDLALLSRVAQQAGEIAMRYFGHAPEAWIKEKNSPVSEADLAVDAFLKHELLAARGHYGWISEETVDERDNRAFRRFFVVDPIDGTRGFLEQRADWCISLAVVENGRPVAGVLECPVKQEHFTARLGSPALMNGRVIQVAAPDTRPEKLISCRASMVKKLPSAVLSQLRFEKHIASLAYRLALLSSGRLDGVFIRPSCHDWDIAAADLILQQSGGVLCNVDSQPVLYQQEPFCHDFLIASSNEMFNDILHIVRDAELG